MADFPVATQDDIAAAQAREAAGKAAAEAANIAWRTGTAPVLPVMGSPSGITQAEQADAAREAAKHAAAFHPAEYYGVNPADLGNVPLSQIASRYGTGFADIVQGYYTQNPTAEAQAIKQRYAAAHGGAVENPYDPDTAAGIAWLSARQGTPVSASLGQKAIQQGYQGDLYAVSGISTVPTRDYSSGMLTGSKMVAALPDKTTTVYMPYGEYAQIEMKGAKALLDYQTGELGVYQRPYGHAYYMLTGGGGRAALQSGMFTVEKPETPYVVSQEGVGKYVLPSGAGLSRLGAEAYGGVVRPLDERTLAPNEAISRYAGSVGQYNLANLVQQIPAGKAEVPGAKIPWSVEAGTPALSYMDERGIVAGSAIALPASDRLVGSKIVASTPTYGTAEAGVLPLPFVSKTGTPFEQNVAGLRQSLEKRPLDVYLSGGLVGEYFFGEKSPQVVQGFVGSVVDFATGVATLGTWQPAKERLQTTTPEGKVYEYGEYTKAGESLGAAFRERTGGYTPEQLEMYGRQLEQKQGIQYIPEKIVFGTGAVVATRPEKIATAYGGGAALVIGGGAISGGLQTIGAGAGTAAAAARAALAGGKYVLPVVFTGAMGYSVTEGLTATPERTTINIGKMLPEAAGAAVGGGSAYMLAGRNLPIGFQTKKEPITYIFTEEIPAGVKTVSEIRKSPLGEMGLPPKQYQVAPTEFSMKTGTEVMDIGYVLTGRKAGALPSGVVEGLKPPAPLTRGIQLEYMEPGLPGVQGMLTGAPKATRPMTPAEAAFGLKLSIEPIATAIPKGLETRFGGGTGISGRTLEQIVNPEIAPITQRTTYGSSIESVIAQRETAARVAPAMQAAEAQRIVPSATTRAFEKPVSIGTKQFEETLFGITEGEKRVPAVTPKKAVAKKIPTGMQIDLLREAIGKRKQTVFSTSIEPFRVATETEIRAQIAPTRRPAKEFLIREEIAPRQRPATEAEIMQMITPTQRPVAVAESRRQIKTEARVPVQYQKQQVTQQLVQPQIQITVPSQRQVSAPSRVTGVQQIPAQAAVNQQQTPYVPMVLQTAAPTQLQAPAPASYQKQTPYVPPVYPTVPSTPIPGVPTTPQKTPPTYVPPVFPGVPTYISPTTRPPTKPPAEPPAVPGVGGFFWPAGTPGSTPGRRPRRAAFMETFMMGLDVGFGMGGRRPRAKSFTTPKKYKTKAPAAKKKGGKK